MKARVIVADPPWPFGDKLTMSDVKRGSESNYDVMTVENIKNLDVESIVADDAVLALWVPGALVADGTGPEVMKAWGFTGKQTHVWVKTKKVPLKKLLHHFKSYLDGLKRTDPEDWFDLVDGRINRLKAALKGEAYPEETINDVLAFGMGRLFRQCHEICLIGTKGRPYSYLKDKSQRSVHFMPIIKHSGKPEDLQNMLEKMFPRVNKVELFARRDRPKWTCVGLECPSSKGEDIKDSIERIKNL